MSADFTVGEKEHLMRDMKDLTKSYYDALKRIKELTKQIEELKNEVESLKEDKVGAFYSRTLMQKVKICPLM